MATILSSLNSTGFIVVPGVYSHEEICTIESIITSEHGTKPMFGERQFLQRTPGLLNALMNLSFRKLLDEVAPGYFMIKSIYFDKAPQVNWFVSWHQDLNIFVKEKIETPGFKNWTKKENEFGVQPPTEFLGNIVTVRIHLDDTDATSGALKVIPYSHSEGVIRSTGVSFSDEYSELCTVKSGCVMLMKPLLFHSSSRSRNNARRRLIHIELCSLALPNGLEWAQKLIPEVHSL